jgi:hypothetical protein
MRSGRGMKKFMKLSLAALVTATSIYGVTALQTNEVADRVPEPWSLKYEIADRVPEPWSLKYEVADRVPEPWSIKNFKA